MYVYLQEEVENPTFYIRDDEVFSNVYSSDSHPNDKRNTYKRGQSKGRMLGLEQAGWIGYIISKKLNL